MVPDMRHVPQKLHGTGLYDLRTHEGQSAFVDAVVSTLHGLDSKWGHLIKKPGQTSIHDHGEDAALYKHGDGTATAVDFVGGAGGPNPQPAWQVDQEGRYSDSDWFDPTDHGIYQDAAPAPTYPSYEALGGDEGGKKITRILEADYKRAKGFLDGECGTWPQRTNYDFLTRKVATVEDSIAKHQPEWRAALNAERVANGLPPITW